MLDVVGTASLGALIDETVPPVIRQSSPLELLPALSEPEALARLGELADQNEVMSAGLLLEAHAALRLVLRLVLRLGRLRPGRLRLGRLSRCRQVVR